MSEGFHLFKHVWNSVFTIKCSCVRRSVENDVIWPILHIETLVRMWSFSVWVWRIMLGADPGNIWWLSSYIHQVLETESILSELCLFGLLYHRHWPSLGLPGLVQVDYFVIVSPHLHRLGKIGLIRSAASTLLSRAATLYERGELCHLCITQVLHLFINLRWICAFRAVNTENTCSMTVSYQLISAKLVLPRLFVFFILLYSLQPVFILLLRFLVILILQFGLAL